MSALKGIFLSGVLSSNCRVLLSYLNQVNQKF